MSQSTHRRKTQNVLVALAISTGVFGVFVLWLTILRETPMFWTYRSAYPVWFRDFVRYAYIPLLGVYFFATTTLGYSMARHHDQRLQFATRTIIPGLLWTLGLAILIGIAL